MKIVAAKPELCNGCYVCEDTCAQARFKANDRSKSSIRISENPEGGFLINVCDQCGECIDICPAQAIYRTKNGTVMVRKKDCVGCYACIGFCPTGAMHMHGDLLEPFKCTVCGKCTEECPTGAIYIAEVSK